MLSTGWATESRRAAVAAARHGTAPAKLPHLEAYERSSHAHTRTWRQAHPSDLLAADLTCRATHGLAIAYTMAWAVRKWRQAHLFSRMSLAR